MLAKIFLRLFHADDHGNAGNGHGLNSELTNKNKELHPRKFPEFQRRSAWTRLRVGPAVVIGVTVVSSSLHAQQPITLPQAIDLALKQSHAATAATATLGAARARE